jgi:hypothetical protein
MQLDSKLVQVDGTTSANQPRSLAGAIVPTSWSTTGTQYRPLPQPILDFQTESRPQPHQMRLVRLKVFCFQNQEAHWHDADREVLDVSSPELRTTVSRAKWPVGLTGLYQSEATAWQNPDSSGEAESHLVALAARLKVSCTARPRRACQSGRKRTIGQEEQVLAHFTWQEGVCDVRRKKDFVKIAGRRQDLRDTRRPAEGQ